MKLEIEALGRLVDVASEIEVGIAELAQGLEGEAQVNAARLRDAADKLADALTVIYIEMTKQEAARERTQAATSGSTES